MDRDRELNRRDASATTVARSRSGGEDAERTHENHREFHWIKKHIFNHEKHEEHEEEKGKGFLLRKKRE